MKYFNNGKQYNVSNVTYGGACIQVNGTTITDVAQMHKVNDMPTPSAKIYTVFVDGDERVFLSFADAYEFATTQQRNTFSI